MKESRKLLSDYMDYGSYSKIFDAEKLLVWAAIENNLKDDKVYRVMEWKGKRDLYDDDYRQTVNDVWFKFSKFDSYSSPGSEEFRKWIEMIILYESDRQKKQVLEIKKDKIERLKEEIKEIELEVEQEIKGGNE